MMVCTGTLQPQHQQRNQDKHPFLEGLSVIIYLLRSVILTWFLVWGSFLFLGFISELITKISVHGIGDEL